MEWQNDPNSLVTTKKTSLIFDKISEKERKQEMGSVKFARNSLFDYEKNPELAQSNFESNGQIKKRYLSLFENLSDMSIISKDTYVNVVIAHASMIEFFFLLTDNARERANYCSINIYQNQICEDRYNFGQYSCRNTILEKNYYAYQAKNRWAQNKASKDAGISGFFNKIFCGFCGSGS
jgi:hypothetical protein